MPNPLFLRDLSLDDLNNMDLGGLAGLQVGHRNTMDRTASAFKQLGKFVYADHWARNQITAVQKIVVGSVNQVQVADSSYYDDLIESVMPFRKSLESTLAALEQARAFAVTACTSLLTKAIAVDLGLPVGSSLATVGVELVAAMRAYGLVVAGRGTTHSIVGGFDEYFRTQLGNIQLPTTDGVPNVPDSWIDDDLT